jgi:LPS export ABC transporter protein LptC
MRRSRLRAALLVVVAAALAGIGWQVSRSVGARRTHTLADLQDFLPQAAQRIQNFRRAKVENGRTVWEITADDAQYFETDSAIVVVQPTLRVFLRDGGREVTVHGAEGRLTLDGRELAAVTLGGGVTVTLDDLELQTPAATYDRARDLITSSAEVTVRGRTVDLRGRGMEVSVGPQLVRLLGDVHTVLRGAADAARS